MAYICARSASLAPGKLQARCTPFSFRTIRCTSRRLVNVRSGLEDDGMSDSLKADMARYKSRAVKSAPKPEVVESNGLKENIDKVLMADFFFILAILSWLAAGVVQNTATGSSPLLDAWYPLWMPVFQPALGIFMAGALVSGAAGWLQSKQKS